ncbi:hypothetical protein [Paracoccus aerius]|uniref:Chromosome partitioning protein ParB n=1 Tax=Paracoccus aerius TaxID=1915382 RepID=A0ABS1SA45_9RHOB|nr:hypothetical protein [Paracoccus aerius]MBL3675621.1 hypothetical protein [Paracoccus aerius]GHG35779.1 hypothetical protein GCM10017322_38310 [Paracoccus aerius]
MAKKGSFSFAGMIDPSAEAVPIKGVEQRGAGETPPPASAPTPSKRGRPPKARTATEARPSFGLDPETHAKFKIWLLRRGMSMQDYLEAHIAELVKDERL